MMFYLAKIWSYLYGLSKDRFGVHLPGLGFALRQVRVDRVISVRGRKMLFNHKVAASYARPIAGSWNEPETHLLLDYVVTRFPGALCFVDVGANIGEMVVDVSRHRNVASIVAFEPIGECCRSIRESLALNGYDACRIVEKLIGAEAGLHRFAVSKDPQTSSVVSSSSDATAGEIQMTTLDEELSQLSNPAIVLIDVEGYEPQVLSGGAQWISSAHPLIIFEYNTISKKHYSMHQIRKILGSQYEIYRLRPDGRLDEDIDHAWNCVAVHQRSSFAAIVHSIILKPVDTKK